MLSLLVSIVEVLSSSDEGISFVYEAYSPYDPPEIVRIAIPQDANYSINYSILETQPIEGNYPFKHSSPYEHERYDADVDYVLIRIYPVGEGIFRKRIRFDVKWNEGRKGSGGNYKPLHRNFLNYPFPRSWIERKAFRKKASPFVGAGLWIGMYITESGMYRIDYEDLKALGISDDMLKIDGFRMIALIDTLKSSIEFADSLFKDVAIDIHDADNDGFLEEGEYIRFFAEDPEGFRNINGRIDYFRHPYDNRTAYFLALNSPIPGKRISYKAVPYGSPTNSTGLYRHERENVNLGRKGKVWLGERITSSEPLSLDFTLEGIVSNMGYITVSLVGVENTSTSVGNASLEIYLNGVFLDVIQTYSIQRSTKTIYVSNLQPNNTLKIVLRDPSNGEVYLDYFQVEYERRIPTSGKVFFRYGGNFLIDGEKLVLNVTDPYEPYILQTGYDNVQNESIYFIVDVHRKPKLFIANFGRNLYSMSTNFVIITPSIFKNAFNTYVQYRSDRLPIPCGMDFCITQGKVDVVSLEEVFMQFALGIRDPVAIRNFLYTLYRNGELYYAMFVGDATYDYKGYITNEGNLFPVYYDFNEAFDINLTVKGSTDDFYADFDGDRYADVFIGRLPFRNKSELMDYLRRVIDYETGTYFSFWRNRVLLVADDFVNSGNACEITLHLMPSDQIQRSYIPASTDVWHIYLHEYEDVSRATDELFNKLSEGVMFMNVFAHGNPSQITSERLLTLEHMGRFHFPGKPPFISVLSCKVNTFDRIYLAGPKGLGETMIANKDGAIGVLSSTALSFAGPNITYSFTVFSEIQTRGKLPIGYLSLRGKNNQYYVLFGDPSVLVGYESMDSNLELPDTAYVGSLYEGSFIDENTYFASIGIKPKEVQVSNCSITYNYLQETKDIYRAVINSDVIRAYIPKNLSTNDTLYVKALYKFGIKFKDSILVAFNPDLIEEDTLGPELKLLYYGKELSDSAKLPLRVELTFWAKDEHGIYLSPGRRDLEVFVDDQLYMKLTNYFTYYPNSYTEGEAKFVMDMEENPGLHRITLRAWDNYDNFSFKDYYLIFEGEYAGIRNLLIYPHPYVPAKGKLYLTFFSTSPGTGFVRIYTLNGDMVMSRSFSISSGNNVVDLDRLNIGSGLYVLVMDARIDGRSVKLRKKLVVAR